MSFWKYLGEFALFNMVWNWFSKLFGNSSHSSTQNSDGAGNMSGGSSAPHYDDTYYADDVADDVAADDIYDSYRHDDSFDRDYYDDTDDVIDDYDDDW